jgi:hypothetical protein
VFFIIHCIFLFCTYNTVSTTLKRVLKRRSFRYAFQEHLLKFLMLAVTHSGLLLFGHCTSRHFKFKTYNCSSSYQRYQPFYLPNTIFLALCFELFFNFRGKIEKNIVVYSFYTPFCRTCFLYSTRRCAPRAVKNACDKNSYNKLLFRLFQFFKVPISHVKTSVLYLL